MPPLATLIKIAGIGGLITASTGYFFRYLYSERIRTTKTYKKALEIVHNHEKTVTHLGEPIKEGIVETGNFDREDIRTFSVILKGSKTRGLLNCEVLLREADKQPELSKLEIKFADIPNKIFVIQAA